MLAADTQTLGRGRWDRSWYSPPKKGLYASVLLYRGKSQATHFHLLTLGVAVALVRVLENHTGLSFEMRWPNDIYISNKKIAGILTEEYRQFWIIGIGVNLLGPPQSFPKDLAEQATTLEHESGQTLSPGHALQSFLDVLESYLLESLRKNPEQIVTDWQLGSHMLGKPVMLRAHGQKGEEVVRGKIGRAHV